MARFIVAIVIFVLCPLVARTSAQVNVTQKNNNLSRNGLYIDPAFTPGNAANLLRDVNFDGAVVGNVHAQPLYVEGGANGAMLIVVTASNNVYALNAMTGTIIWQRNVGTPVTSGLPCGNINPVGAIGTPVVDLPSRSLFFDALIDGPTKKHFIFSLNVDTGATNAGWPVDVNATATNNGNTFTSLVQEDRGALALVNGIVYVPYSGYAGDCGTYRGWVVGVQANNPSGVMAWATTAIGGGIWGHSGVASDGTNLFVITGNTFNTGGNWMGGEAIIRLQAGPTFGGNPSDYWAPTNWFSLDQGDTDLGGVSAILINVPGANPSQLVLALGKDGNAYLLNRNNLGGITQPVAQVAIGGAVRGQSSATYTTSQGIYFVFRLGSSALKAYKITPTTPPTIVSAWSVSEDGQGSPWVTTTDGTNNAIVWVVGAEGDGELHGYNGDTGAVIYAGGDVMSGTRKWNNGIVARGSIYVANDNKVYKFRVPGGTPTPTPNPSARLGNISTRAFVQTGDNVVIGGFIVQGTEPKRVIIRAIGPELTQYGVPNFLANPTLELHDGSEALIASNDDWSTTIIGGIITSDQVADIWNSGHAPGDGRESAIIANLPPGNYTAIVRGVNNMTGVALVEVYDLSAETNSILGNISTRSFVQTGDNLMIGGLIVQGTQPKHVIIRAIGPELTQYGVPNFLANPTLELHDGTGALIASNDNWSTTIIGGIITEDQVQDIQNSGHAPTEASESAIIANLPPGNYTAIVRGVNNITGVALVEVYVIDEIITSD
jgi:outer membrane protein assembly factor BamB